MGLGYGQLCGTAIEVGQRLEQQGIGVTVVDPVWALPVSPALLRLVAEHDLVATIEDNGVVGGLGARVALEAASAGLGTPVRAFGIPQDFLPQGSRRELLQAVGLTAQQIAREVIETFTQQVLSPARERLRG